MLTVQLLMRPITMLCGVVLVMLRRRSRRPRRRVLLWSGSSGRIGRQRLRDATSARSWLGKIKDAVS